MKNLILKATLVVALTFGMTSCEEVKKESEKAADKTEVVVKDVKEAAKEVANDVKDATNDAIDATKEAANDAVDATKEAAKDVKEAAKEMVNDTITIKGDN